jgi:uroporphyrin-III C-methyltransferase
MTAATPIVLAGAGPGDPDLLTLRTEAALAGARLVVADPALLPLATAFASRAEVVAAGAAPEAAAVALAESAGLAVRLYRGDPWLHPAYAAEAAALAARGVATETIPGPPVETALAGGAGLALHHRPVSVTLTLGPPGTGDGAARTLACEVPDIQPAVASLPSGQPWAAVVDGAVRRHGATGPGLLVVGEVAR